jgi:hypothetical protein
MTHVFTVQNIKAFIFILTVLPSKSAAVAPIAAPMESATNPAGRPNR